MITLFVAFVAGSGVLGYLVGRRDRKHTRVKWHDPRLGSLGVGDRLIEQAPRHALPAAASRCRCPGCERTWISGEHTPCTQVSHWERRGSNWVWVVPDRLGTLGNDAPGRYLDAGDAR